MTIKAKITKQKTDKKIINVTNIGIPPISRKDNIINGITTKLMIIEA